MGLDKASEKKSETKTGKTGELGEFYCGAGAREQPTLFAIYRRIDLYICILSLPGLSNLRIPDRHGIAANSA